MVAALHTDLEQIEGNIFSFGPAHSSFREPMPPPIYSPPSPPDVLSVEQPLSLFLEPSPPSSVDLSGVVRRSARKKRKRDFLCPMVSSNWC